MAFYNFLETFQSFNAAKLKLNINFSLLIQVP